MSARHRLSYRSTAALGALLIAIAVAPAMASARPAGDGLGPRSQKIVEPPAAAPYVLHRATNEKFVAAPPAAPAPTVVRTVIKEDAVSALPIALAGAALLIALAGAGYVLVRIPRVRHQLGGEV
jgi:hypothetical protein